MDKLDLDYYEQVIIYKTLTDEQYLGSIIDHVNPKYFNDGNIKNIFTLIKNFYLKRNTVPTITEIKSYLINDELKTCFKKIVTNFKDIDRDFNDDELIENTERFLKERAIYSTMLDVAEDVSRGKVDTSYILDRFEKSCNVDLNRDVGLDLFDDVDDFIKDLNTDEPVIPTKWEWLDDKLGGGLLQQGRAMYVFAGETNIGKSIFLGNIASNIASQGKTVVLITLEMSEMIYARRLASNITLIPFNSLRGESTNVKFQLDDVKKHNPKNRIIIKEFPPSTISPQNLQSFLKQLHNYGIKPDAVVIDYLNLLKASMGNNSYERIKNVSESVRALSYTFNCPFITATQLNRTGYDEDNPGLNTISESIGTAATADGIFSIFQNEEDRELGVIKMGIMKNRFGVKGVTIQMKIDYSTLTVTEDEEVSDDNSLLNDISNSLSVLSNE